MTIKHTGWKGEYALNLNSDPLQVQNIKAAVQLSLIAAVQLSLIAAVQLSLTAAVQLSLTAAVQLSNFILLSDEQHIKLVSIWTLLSS